MSRTKSILIFSVFLVISWSAVADPARTMPGIIGRVDEHVQARVVLLDREPAGMQLGQVKDDFPGTNFLRLHFVVVAPSQLQGVTVKVLDSFGTETDNIEISGAVGISDMWTTIIPGSGYKVQVVGTRQPSGSTLIVREVARSVTPVEPQSIIGADDMVPITNVTDPKLLSVARATAKFVFQQGGDTYVCTAFLIGDRRMITNQHCMEDASICKTVIVEFDFNTGTSVPAAKQRRCLETKGIDYDLDFAVFDIDRAPPEPTITPVVFATTSPGADTDLVIVEHPAGQSKRVSIKDCKVQTNPVTGRADGTDFTHSCDTLGGSSGSGVLNVDLQVVGLHHFGTGGDQPTYNRAVRIEKIVAKLKELGLTSP